MHAVATLTRMPPDPERLCTPSCLPQTKELPAASRARYALLVAALAVRDDELVGNLHTTF